MTAVEVAALICELAEIDEMGVDGAAPSVSK